MKMPRKSNLSSYDLAGHLEVPVTVTFRRNGQDVLTAKFTVRVTTNPQLTTQHSFRILGLRQ